MKIQKVGIIGCDSMGSGIAQADSFRFGDCLDIDYFKGDTEMTELMTAKYIRTNTTRPSYHAEVTAPIPVLYCDENYGNKGFWMYWKCIEKPYVDEVETHKHDFDQYLVFLSGDPRNMLDLGGEIEFTMSEDGVHKEVHTFTTYTTVYVKAGLYHCPLVYKKVTKPIIFYDFVNTMQYKRKFQDAGKTWQPGIAAT